MQTSAQIGELCDRVTIEQPSASANSQSSAGTVTWSTLATVWASVVAAGAGGEAMRAAAVTAVHAYDVVIRYRADVTPKMRLSWMPYGASAAKTLQILGVQPVAGRRGFLELSCAETA